MTQEIRDIFPIKVRVNRKLINNSNPCDARNCQGARTLKKVLSAAGYECDVKWNFFRGTIAGENLCITTKENVCMPDVKRPRYVTLIIARDFAKDV